MARSDDFSTRQQALQGLSDEELKRRFWELAREVVNPMLELARTHTSPSIERSVLLRMGFSSQETQAIVTKVVEHGLLGKGAGHVVWRVSQLKKISLHQAGLELVQGMHWNEIKAYFGGREGR